MWLLSLAPDFPQALLATVVVRATVVLLAAWVLTFLLRRAAAATRHAVWSVAIASLMLLPAVSLVLPRWNMPAPVAAAAPAVPAMASVDQVNTSPAVVSEGHDHAMMAAGGAVPSRRTPLMPATILVVIWALGAAFGLGRLSAGWAAARRLVRRARRPESEDAARAARELSVALGIGRDVRVLVSDTLSVPVNCGLVQPVVLLPASAHRWSDERLRVVLLHELAHVRRWDYAALLVTEAARAVYWFNPLVWWLRARPTSSWSAPATTKCCAPEPARSSTPSICTRSRHPCRAAGHRAARWRWPSPRRCAPGWARSWRPA